MANLLELSAARHVLSCPINKKKGQLIYLFLVQLEVKKRFFHTTKITKIRHKTQITQGSGYKICKCTTEL